MNAPKTLQQAVQYFSDFENCRQFMVMLRWPDGKVKCPVCDSGRVTYLQNARLYKCSEKHAKQKFSLKVGTVFEDSPIPLEKWLPAVWMLVNCKNGVSSYEIHRALGVTQKTAWFMLHRIRLAMQTGSFAKFGGSGGEVEADETFVGGKISNMHKRRKVELERKRSEIRNVDAWGHIGKTAVQGILDRDAREIRAKVVPDVKRETLQYEILNQVQFGTKLYTDDARAYNELARLYAHEVVNHEMEYVRGRVHTNGMENFWSLLKRTLHGTYVAVEPFHLDRYVV